MCRGSPAPATGSVGRPCVTRAAARATARGARTRGRAAGARGSLLTHTRRGARTVRPVQVPREGWAVRGAGRNAAGPLRPPTPIRRRLGRRRCGGYGGGGTALGATGDTRGVARGG